MGDQQNLYTLAEASQLTGLSTEALRLRIKRGKLAAERGNDGHPRVRLTSADLEDIRRQVDQQKPTLIRQDADRANAIRVLETAVEALREQAGRDRERAEAERDAERARAAQAEREREEARVRAAAAESEAKGLREQVRAEQDRAEAERERAEAVRAELAEWTAGGPLTRAFRAFLSRRGRS